MMRTLRCLAPLLLAACVAPGLAWADTVALLVGVGQYRAFSESGKGNLEGPQYDLAAFRELLLGQWRLRPDAVRVLRDQRATKLRILSEIDALMERSKPGDEVLIYFSGHGTGALDSASGLPLPHGSGAWVPHDWPGPRASKTAQVEGLIVGRRDLRPRLSRLEAAGRKLFVIADACYSGASVRSPKTGESLPGRFLPMTDETLLADMSNSLAGRTTAAAPAVEPYPYRATVYLAAAAEGEVARDIPREHLQFFPTIDGKPHGAMTDAVLRVLSGAVDADYNRDGHVDFREIHTAVSGIIGSRAYGHTPQLLPPVVEDKDGLAATTISPLRQATRPSLPVSGASSRLRVAMTGLPAELQSSLRRLPDIEWVEGQAQADLRLSLRPGVLHLLSAAGDVLQSVPLAQADSMSLRLGQLGWAHRLKQLGESGRRSVLPFDLNPAAFGGNFVAGQRFNLAVRPAHGANLAVIDIDSNGKVSVLYPSRQEELGAIAAGRASFVPGERPEDLIEARQPYGTDLLFAFAFERPPANIARWMGMEQVEANDPRLSLLVEDIKAARGSYSFAYKELRVFGRP